MSTDEKRNEWRETKARQRAAMSPEQRAEKRRAQDAAFRDAHRAERREADRQRYLAKSVANWHQELSKEQS